MYHKIANVTKIVDKFVRLGFNDEQILDLVSNKKQYIKRIDELESSFAFYKEEMLKRNYSEEEIYALATKYPASMFHRFYKGIMKKEYVEYINQYRLETHDNTSTLDLDGVTKVLKAIGMSDKQLDQVYTFKCPILRMSVKALNDNIKYQKSCGITDIQLKNNINSYARILEYGENELEPMLKSMQLCGLDKYALGKLLCTCSKFKLKLNPERFISNLKWAVDKELDLNILGRNILKSNVLVINKPEALDNNFNSIVKLGLSEDNVRKIISATPSTLTMDKNMMAYTMNLLIVFGMTEEEMIKVVTEYSTIFTCSIDNLVAKLRVLRDYNLIWYIVKKPKNLIQSAELIEARAAYLKNYYYYNEEEFARYVFSAEENFVRMFEIDNYHVKCEKILQKL